MKRDKASKRQSPRGVRNNYYVVPTLPQHAQTAFGVSAVMWCKHHAKLPGVARRQKPHRWSERFRKLSWGKSAVFERNQCICLNHNKSTTTLIFSLKIRLQTLLHIFYQSVELQLWWTHTHWDRLYWQSCWLPRWQSYRPTCWWSQWRPNSYLYKRLSSLWEGCTDCEFIERMALEFQYTGKTLVDLQGWSTGYAKRKKEGWSSAGPLDWRCTGNIQRT